VSSVSGSYFFAFVDRRANLYSVPFIVVLPLEDVTPAVDDDDDAGVDVDVDIDVDDTADVADVGAVGVV
jgi:hypothetical protein